MGPVVACAAGRAQLAMALEEASAKVRQEEKRAAMVGEWGSLEAVDEAEVLGDNCCWACEGEAGGLVT